MSWWLHMPRSIAYECGATTRHAKWLGCSWRMPKPRAASCTRWQLLHGAATCRGGTTCLKARRMSSVLPRGMQCGWDAHGGCPGHEQRAAPDSSCCMELPHAVVAPCALEHCVEMQCDEVQAIPPCREVGGEGMRYAASKLHHMAAAAWSCHMSWWLHMPRSTAYECGAATRHAQWLGCSWRMPRPRAASCTR